MNFKDYLSRSEKSYPFRIKTLVVLDDSYVETIERHLNRYVLRKMDKVKKTILQKNPVDFPEHKNKEVYILDIELGMPVSGHIIQLELVGLLGLPGDFLVVRGENDPLEQIVDASSQLDDIEQQGEKQKLKRNSLLDFEQEYPEADQQPDGSNYFGDRYNSAFLKQLAGLERNEYNDALVNQKELDKDAKQPSLYGNFVDTDTKVKRTYVSDKGKKKTLAGKPNSI